LKLEFDYENNKEQILIYNVSGLLIWEIDGPTIQIDINELPSGVYFIRLKNHPKKPLKFIKN
jgi:hypothetical protein